MVAFQIREVKKFMAKLLGQMDFDDFCVSEAEVFMAAGYKINGHRNKNFYTKEEWEAMTEPEFLRWEEIRPMVFQMIRGNKTPTSLSVVLLLSRAKTESLLQDSGAGLRMEDVTGLYLNLKFTEGALMAVTATGLATFLPDKQLERAWDAWVKEFWKEHEIEFDEV
ncbi:MAG: hypothetical protein IJY09_00200 [Lachnospiraceae bacterium]|nr:hypothetical protein [Lachnospiraceae bacterium]